MLSARSSGRYELLLSSSEGKSSSDPSSDKSFISISTEASVKTLPCELLMAHAIFFKMLFIPCSPYLHYNFHHHNR